MWSTALEVASQVEVTDLESLYRAHARTVARWAERLGGPGTDPEDVVQEVFIVAQRQLSGFRGESRVTTWLYGITRNVVRHRRRKEKFRRWLTGDPEMPSGERPDLDLERKEASRLVYRALDELSDTHHTLIILFELEGLAGAEIAELMGMKVESLWVALHRARARFLASVAKLEGRKEP